MEIVSRDYVPSEYENQRNLFKLSFPETIGTPIASDPHYDWKFKTFPAQPASYQFVSEDTELVGYYAAIPYKYKIGNATAICGMVCDVMTHPCRRGKGIFTKLGRYSTDRMKELGLNFTSGYPIRPEVIPGHLKVGWQIVVKMPMYLRLLGLKSFLPKPIRFLSVVTDPIIRGLQFWTGFKNRSYEIKVLNREQFLSLPGYSEFLDAWLAEQKNGLIKDKKFMAWRTSAPHTVYEFVILYSQSRIVGFSLVRSTVLKNVSSLAIIDMMILKDHFKGADCLHEELKALAIAKKNDAIVGMMTPQWARNYRLVRSLYIPTPAVFSLIIKKLTSFEAEANLFKPECWHLFWIDSDDL